MKNLHLGPILPDVVNLHDVRVLDELQNGDFSFNSHWNAHLALPVILRLAVRIAESSEAAILHQIGHTPVHDFDSGELLSQAVTAEPNTSRGAFSQGSAKLPGTNMRLVITLAATAGGGLVRSLRKPLGLVTLPRRLQSC